MQLWCVAQKTIPEYGSVTLADLKQTTCAFDKDAPALKLFDVQEILLDESGSGYRRLITERRVRIKIFNEKGFQYASIKLPYYNKNRSTKIKDLNGVVYNLDSNGKIITQKLEKKDFFRGKAEEKISMINFTFPNIRAGSIIEFRYKKVERNMYQVDPWLIQSEIPTAYTSTTLTTPSFARVKEKIFGTDTIPHTLEILFHSGSYSERRRFYYKENIKAFKPEPYMTSITDNLMKVVFMVVPQSSIFTDVFLLSPRMWNEAGNVLLQAPFFGAQIRSAIPGTQAVIDSARRLQTDQGKINFIYERTKKQFIGREEQTLYPDDIAEAWSNHTGNSAEINLVLLNLLQKAGVRAYPLLVSTRAHGFIATDFPSFAQINGVDVVAVDSSNVYVLDAYQKFHSYKTPPFNLLNRKAFLLDSANMHWVVIGDEGAQAQNSVGILGTLGSDGVLRGTGSIESQHYARIAALDSSDEDVDKTKQNSKKQQGVTIRSFTEENVDVDSLPLVQNIEFTYELEHTDSFYFINPLFLMLQSENPFVVSERNTDIDFGSNQLISLQLKIQLPQGYTVENLPGNVLLRSSDSTMLYNRITFADTATLVFRQFFTIKRSLFGKEEYEGIREFFNKMYGLMADEIILKKASK